MEKKSKTRTYYTVKIEHFKTLQNDLVKLPKVKTVVEVIKCEVKWIISEQ